MVKNETFPQVLSDILVKHEVLTPKRAGELQAAFGESTIEEFDDFLIEEGLVSHEDVLEALSVFYEVPSFDARGHFFEEFLLRKFPKDFLVRNYVIPLEQDENMLMVVAAYPERPGLESEMREFVSYDIEFLVGVREDIFEAIDEYYDKSLQEDPNEYDWQTEERDSNTVKRLVLSDEEEEFPQPADDQDESV
jgi:hypothetical protein